MGMHPDRECREGHQEPRGDQRRCPFTVTNQRAGN
jgi:hypothetical protein